MGLLDSILGSVMNSGANAGGMGGMGDTGNNNPLLDIAMQMLNQQGGAGGLGGLIDQFKQGGLGHLADSWVGTGDNLPISADQISQVLGSGKIGEIAGQLGLSPDMVSGGLSTLLPELINHVTPDGRLPQSNDMITNALSMFLKR